MMRIYKSAKKKQNRMRYYSLGFAFLGLLIGVFQTENAMGMNPDPSSLVELNLKEVPLKKALREIERQTGYHFVMNDNRLKDVKKTVTLSIKSENIEDVLNQLLLGTNITYQIKKKQITLIPPPPAETKTSPLSMTGSVSNELVGSQNRQLIFDTRYLFEVKITGLVKDDIRNP